MPEAPTQGRHRLLYIMNIPSPYRWHLFSKLHEVAKTKGIDFEVAFLSKQSRRRKWQLEDFPRSFPYHLSWAINFSRNGEKFLNPAMICRTLLQRWDWIILGGYDNPTNAILAGLPLPRTQYKLIRNEGNLQAHHRYKSGVIAFLKRFVLKRCDGYLIPGQRGIEWLDYWLPERAEEYTHIFPNVIDDKRLLNRVQELRQDRGSLRSSLNIRPEKRVFFTPARLHPDKGLLEFLQQLPDDFGRKNVWLIAGEGPLRSEIKNESNRKGMADSVRLLGHVSQDRMYELYALADIFALPSISDPNPLSSIEAAFAGLPLLISKRLGNYPELMKHGKTGWGFDPTNADEVRTAIEEASVSGNGRLQTMSQAVSEVAQTKFQSGMVCEQLLDYLLKMQPKSQ